MFYDFKFTDHAGTEPRGGSSEVLLRNDVRCSQSARAGTRILRRMAGTDGREERIHQNNPAGMADDGVGQSSLYLAPRELDVLIWAAQGKTTWETAQLLGLSEATVSFYVRRACSRLGVKSKIHAVAKCISEGLFKI